jgi:hypothetical protein
MSSGLPSVVYNVPSRTGTNVEAATLLRLAKPSWLTCTTSSTCSCALRVGRVGRPRSQPRADTYLGHDGRARGAVDRVRRHGRHGGAAEPGRELLQVDLFVVDNRDQLRKKLIAEFGRGRPRLDRRAVIEIVSGQHPGRTATAQRIVLVTGGIARQDNALAPLAYEQALKRGLGMPSPRWPGDGRIQPLMAAASRTCGSTSVASVSICSSQSANRIRKSKMSRSQPIAW